MSLFHAFNICLFALFLTTISLTIPASSQTVCAPGWFGGGDNPYGFCFPCYPGTYSTDGTVCVNCPANTYGPSETATSESDCLACPSETTSPAGSSSSSSCVSHGINSTSGTLHKSSNFPSDQGPNFNGLSAGIGISVNSNYVVPKYYEAPVALGITPSSVYSTFMISFNSVASITSTSNIGIAINLARNGVAVQTSPLSLVIPNAVDQGIPISFSYVDSPQTTSSVTYSLLLSNLASGSGYGTIGWFPGTGIPSYRPQSNFIVQEIH